MENNKGASPEKYMVPAVEQAARILFCLAGHASSQMSLLDICTWVGIHKSKAYTILQTLQTSGIVRRNDDGKGYALGPGLLTLSRKVLDDLNAPRLAEPILKELATRIGGTATLGLIAGRNVFVVASHEGGMAIGVTIGTGRRFPLTFGSHGKAIAAFLPREELDLLLQDDHLHFHGAPDKLDRDRLVLELEACRRDGFAMDLGEMQPGLNSISVPVFDPGAAPIGYIALVGFFPADSVADFGPRVVAAGKALSRQLGAKGD